MKTYISLLMAALTLICCQQKPSLKSLEHFAATEQFVEDTFLIKATQKRALVIVAHDDDDCAMAGTIAKLTSTGWEVQQISFQAHYSPRKELGKPGELLYQKHEFLHSSGDYRIGLDTMKTPYLPIPLTEMGHQFPEAEIRAELLEKITAFQPTVLFSLDDIKGGYGHPEHVFLSRLTADLFRKGETGAQRLYQSVFTDHMEQEIVDKWLGPRLKKWGFPNASEMANELYQIDGMPDPTVQVSIATVAQQKMNYLRAYGEDVSRNLRKFLPYFEEFTAEEYFSLFDREFFRVIQ